MSNESRLRLSGFGITFAVVSIILLAELEAGGRHNWISLSALAVWACQWGGHVGVRRGRCRGELEPMPPRLTLLNLD